ncbi:MAG: ATP-binding cassette domain-containing protein, partial [Oscillospiraceae bacterium]|nr:ATP-binding cassette domain-containing protein [Oscillospiraceae bacterium]
MSIIKISGLTFGYEGSFENVFEDVSFNLDTDWKTGFIGRNGRGKTTFLRLLMGELEYRGSISASVDFEYFPYTPPDENELVMEIVREISGAEDWQIYKEISLLGAREDILYRPFCTLSMGERTKCLLAAMFLKENSFLLIDEPTNHLDSGGRAALAEYLRGKRGFIMVSHDRMFLDSVIDHVISINRNDIEVMRGNFSTWEEERRRRDESELAENEKLKKEIKALEKSARRAAEWSANAEGKKTRKDGELAAGRRAYYGEKARKAAARAKAFENRAANALEEKSKLLKNIEKSDDLKICGLKYHSDLICRAEHFSLMYGGGVCRDISFEVRRGDRLRLTGGNGSGKSSVLRAICGENVPYE